jgi:hypothetical protein
LRGRVRRDGGARADVGGVQVAVVQGVDGVAAAVEVKCLEAGVVFAQGVLEVALVDADDRRRVGQVREVAELDLRRFSAAAAAAVVAAVVRTARRKRRRDDSRRDNRPEAPEALPCEVTGHVYLLEM